MPSDNNNNKLFINYYRCPRCGSEWTDTWDATSEDDCWAAGCGLRHITPYKSEDLSVELESELESEEGLEIGDEAESELVGLEMETPFNLPRDSAQLVRYEERESGEVGAVVRLEIAEKIQDPAEVKRTSTGSLLGLAGMWLV